MRCVKSDKSVEAAFVMIEGITALFTVCFEIVNYFVPVLLFSLCV